MSFLSESCDICPESMAMVNVIHAMALPVMEFQVQEYKIKKDFCLKINIPEGNF